MKNLIIFSVFILFSSNTNFNYAQSFEYTIINDEQVAEVLALPLINDWYGFYLLDDDGNEYKVGYMNNNEEFSENFLTYNKPVYIYKSQTKIEMQFTEAIQNITVISKEVYQAQPPYNLIYYYNSTFAGGSILTVTSTRQNDSMTIIRSDGVNEEKTVIPDFDFRLNHDLASFVLFKNPRTQVGKKIKLLVFDEDEFSNTMMKLADIRTQLVNGVRYEYFVLEIDWEIEEEIISGSMFVDQDMNAIKIEFPAMQLEARLESKEQAKDLNNLSDLFVLNTIPVDQSFIEFTTNYRDNEIRNIYYEIQGNYKNLFANTIEQEVIYEDGIYFLALGEEYGLWEEATEKDIMKNLEKKNFDPIDDLKIINLAKKGINGATTTEDKVTNLLSFVSNYIEDDMTIGNLSTVYDIINKQKGDCSEHAFLFNVLARSIGIPSRQVGGYAFDPENNNYSGHAWNEIVINGYWYPVDPMWNGWLPSKLHIKSNEEKDITLHGLSLKLFKIEYENGTIKYF